MKLHFYVFLLLLCASLIFCGCDSKQPAVTTAPITTAPAVDAAETLGVPATADFGGAEYNVLSAGNLTYKDFTFEESSSMPLDNAQYKRKTLVEQNYNIVINEEIKQAYSSGNGPGFQALYTAANAGTTDYTVGLIAGYDVSVLGYSGYLYDMNSMPGVDLTKSWWDQKANEALTIHDLVFFTAGDTGR